MGFLYGFVGAVLGAVAGETAAYSAVSSATDGDGLGVILEMTIFGPVGLILGAVSGVVVSLRLLSYIKTHWEATRSRRKSTLIVTGCILAVPILVAAVIWDAQQYKYPPSDQQLLSNFDHNRTTFDKLAQMTQADKGLMQVHDDWTQPSDPKTVGISAKRIVTYRELLGEVGARHGMQADGLQGADFLCWGQGGATSHDANKGYAYLLVPPKHIFNSLDQYNDQTQSEGLPELQAYRHIEGCWYLYYDYLPG